MLVDPFTEKCNDDLVNRLVTMMLSIRAVLITIVIRLAAKDAFAYASVVARFCRGRLQKGIAV